MSATKAIEIPGTNSEQFLFEQIVNELGPRVTLDQIEAFQQFIADEHGTIVGDKYDDLMLVCNAYSRAVEAEHCAFWLPFCDMPGWKNEVRKYLAENIDGKTVCFVDYTEKR